MLYIMGLGLYDEQDITLRGLNAIRGSVRVYLEAYTSILGVDKAKLEALYGKEVIVADRDMVEMESDSILDGAKESDVSFLVVGDPFGATTHADLVLRAEALSIPVCIIHNASVMNAIGACGLALYNYGQTVSIPFFTDTWRPDSWLERIRENWRLGLHTLCLLDIKVKEQSEENLARGRKIFDPPRYMSTSVALQQLVSLLPNEEQELAPHRTLVVSASRLGAPSQTLTAGTISELLTLDPQKLGQPLHSFVLVGKRMHQIERDFAARFAHDRTSWLRICNDVCLLPTKTAARRLSSDAEAQRVLFEANAASLYDFGLTSKVLFRDVTWQIEGTGLSAWALVGSRASSLVDAALLGRARVEPRGSVRWPSLEQRPSGRNLVESAIRKVAFRTRLESRSALADAGGFTDYTARYGGIRAGDEDALTLRAHLLEHCEQMGTLNTVAEIENVCTLLDVQHLLDMPLVVLSNGQTRRARIARALLSRPEMLILEQPFTGLDVAHRFSLSELLCQLHAAQSPHIVLTSQHDQLPEWITHVVSFKAEGAIDHIGSRTTWTPSLAQATEKPARQQAKESSSAKVLVALDGVNIDGRTPVLRDVTWQIREGERWVLKGHNGSGKTTLLSVILGDHPQSYSLGDSVVLFDRVRSKWATSQLHERIGHTSPEINNAFPRRGGLSTREAIGTGFEAVFCYRPLSAAQHATIDELASQLGRDEKWLETAFVEQRVGEQNLALLMRALVKQPPLIVLDEPLAGMDEKTIAQVHEYLENGLKPEQSLVLVTHYEEEVPSSFDRVLELENGRIIRPTQSDVARPES